MKFSKLGIAYMFKNFLYIFLLCLIPAVFVGLFCGPYQIVEFMNIYSSKEILNFSSIFQILMPFDWLRILLSILGVLLVSVFISMVLGEMERHMRSGKSNFKHMFSYVNNDIMVVMINLVVLAIIYLVFTFLLGSILFLFHLMLSGLGNVPTVLNVIFAIVFCCVHIVVYTFATILFLTNIPNMITNGYSFKEGVSSTCQLIGKSAFKLLLAFILPYAIIIAFISPLAKTNLLWIPNIVCTLLQYMYYSSLAMTSFFELSNTPRYDNRKYYNYNK